MKPIRRNFDVVCVGGGVIGLMTAFELSARTDGKISVAVLEKKKIGAEASWAGAGIIPPASRRHARSAFDRLRGYSYEKFPELSEHLYEVTGIDVGFSRDGGLELVTSEEDSEELRVASQLWAEQSIEFESIRSEELRKIEPELSVGYRHGYSIPGYRQVRNPRFLRALEQACSLQGVEIFPQTTVHGFDRAGDRALQVQLADGGTIHCGAAVVTAGAWSGQLLEEVGYRVPIHPIQGQIVALGTAAGTVRHIILVGKRYLVPRADGLVLVGSTEEDVGFDKRTTKAGIEGLKEFAYSLFPVLEKAEVVATWAGLRPASTIGLPIMGRVPGWTNLWVATGHFRQGLQLSPGSGRLLSDWITGQESFADPMSFSPDAQHIGFRSGFRS